MCASKTKPANKSLAKLRKPGRKMHRSPSKELDHRPKNGKKRSSPQFGFQSPHAAQRCTTWWHEHPGPRSRGGATRWHWRHHDQQRASSAQNSAFPRNAHSFSHTTHTLKRIQESMAAAAPHGTLDPKSTLCRTVAAPKRTVYTAHWHQHSWSSHQLRHPTAPAGSLKRACAHTYTHTHTLIKPRRQRLLHPVR